MKKYLTRSQKEPDYDIGCGFESNLGQEFFILYFSIALRSSQLEFTYTNEIKHGINPKVMCV